MIDVINVAAATRHLPTSLRLVILEVKIWSRFLILSTGDDGDGCGMVALKVESIADFTFFLGLLVLNTFLENRLNFLHELLPLKLDESFILNNADDDFPLMLVVVLGAVVLYVYGRVENASMTQAADSSTESVHKILRDCTISSNTSRLEGENLLGFNEEELVRPSSRS